MKTAGRLDMRTELPALVTCQQIQEQLNVTQAAAYKLMRQLGTIQFPRQQARLRAPRRRPPADRGINNEMSETVHRKPGGKEATVR